MDTPQRYRAALERMMGDHDSRECRVTRTTPVNLFGAILGGYLNIEAPRRPHDQYDTRHLDTVRIAPIR